MLGTRYLEHPAHRQARYDEAVLQLKTACTLAERCCGSSSEEYHHASSELAIVYANTKNVHQAEALLVKVPPSLHSCEHHHIIACMFWRALVGTKPPQAFTLEPWHFAEVMHIMWVAGDGRPVRRAWRAHWPGTATRTSS